LNSGEIVAILAAQVNAQLNGGHRLVILCNKREVLIAEIANLALITKTAQVAEYGPVPVHQAIAHFIRARRVVIALERQEATSYGSLVSTKMAFVKDVHITDEIVAPSDRFS
jgi:hypothetical protein